MEPKRRGTEAEKVFLGDLDIRFLKIKDDYTDRNLGISDDAPKVVAKWCGRCHRHGNPHLQR
ncbi:MAG: hypothetical protein ACLR8Y_10830 [Alistipes indistinctus]